MVKFGEMMLVAIIAFVAGAVVGVQAMRGPYHDIDELQAELAGYDRCMQMAGRMRCSMTPQDFVRYYDIKRKLESIDD